MTCFSKTREGFLCVFWLVGWLDFQFHHNWISKYCLSMARNTSSSASRLQHAAWVQTCLRIQVKSVVIYTTSSVRKPVQQSQSSQPAHCLHTQSYKVFHREERKRPKKKKKVENRFHNVFNLKFVEGKAGLLKIPNSHEKGKNSICPAHHS